MKKKEDLFIEILKYGKENFENGVSFKELSEFIAKKEYPISDVLLVKHFQETFEITDDEGKQYGGDKHILENANLKGRLSIESYFRLIEYEELKEARETSQNAMTRSSIAIGISILAMIISSLLSLYQINTPTILDALTVSELNNIKYDDSVIKTGIGSIDAKQDIIVNELKSTDDKQDVIIKELKSTDDKQDVIIKELKSTNKSIKKANKSLNQLGAKDAPPG